MKTILLVLVTVGVLLAEFVTVKHLVPLSQAFVRASYALRDNPQIGLLLVKTLVTITWMLVAFYICLVLLFAIATVLYARRL